ncbi:hypothetical protein DPMN_004818 [Dreissena polymorpha]|uniref:Uncharacterized protein n=1 Tax=Dreissena polymorpha TaxID=45954 RepID=A0A9D4MR08_DREPO|nr:hypothetical protein DPMN_004818 [Dreissena polymorpha]
MEAGHTKFSQTGTLDYGRCVGGIPRLTHWEMWLRLITSDKPGMVFMGQYASDDEVAEMILKKDVLNGMPSQL